MLARNVSMTAQNLQAALDDLRANPARLLALPEVRQMIARERMVPNLPVTVWGGHGEGVMKSTVEHNMAGLSNLTASDRPDLLVNPLLSINDIRHRLPHLDLLSIGPRTEAEIFALLSHSFHGDRLRAIDLMTYSSWIDCGDMHALPYADESFDVVMMGWVLAYSTLKRRACAEAVRVARPGAYIAVGCQYQPHTVEEWRTITSYDDYDMMFNSAADVVALFGNAVGRVVFLSDIEPEHQDRPGDIIVIFRVDKANAAPA